MINFEYFLAEWLIALITVLVCVWIHSQVLIGLARGRSRLPRGQNRIFLVMLVLLFTHIVEILIFAVAYLVMLQDSAFGQIVLLDTISFVDCIYFSSVVYTTLGFGDLVPTGLIRIITGVEALMGLSLTAWSISSAFIEIQMVTHAQERRDTP
ncbi:MAG: potassium channel family protein [Candidatus Thiodiazotropha sp. (ex Lucinoma borealis)]|nr:potassium channel family protein [Candidatus Thiodiazotropha sp. (ex Lucinoma borealis)]